MSRTRLVTLRVEQKEFEGWKLTADGEGITLSEWLRARLREGGDRGRRKPEKPHSPVLAPPSLSPDVGKKCSHGIEEGLWCRQCRRRV